MPVPDRFTTTRLRAHRLTLADFAEVCRMHCDAVVMTHLGGVRDMQASAVYFERNLTHWDAHGFGLWIVYERDGTEPIGRAMLRHLLVGDVDEIEVGYALYEPFWGQGLASEITSACLQLARDELQRSSVVAVTYPGNDASQHVLAKAGFVYERDITIDGARCRLFRTARTP